MRRCERIKIINTSYLVIISNYQFSEQAPAFTFAVYGPSGFDFHNVITLYSSRINGVSELLSITLHPL